MKLIDKILYYFGYAPITISHEVKFYAVGKHIETVVCRSVLEFNSNESMNLNPNIELEKYRKEKIKHMLIEEIDKSGLINYIQIHNDFHQNPRIYAELRILKT